MRSGVVLALAALGMTMAGAATRAQIGPAPARAPTFRGPAPRVPVPTAALLPRTQAVLDAAVTAGKLPGAVLALGVGDGPPLVVTAGRLADAPGAPPTGGDSLWRVYSMTKPITAVAAMILIEEGRIGFDAPLATYLPAFAQMRVLTNPAGADGSGLASRLATRPITIRELLNHTAGLGYTINLKGPLLHEYERQGILPFASDARTEEKMRAVRPATLQAFANRVAALPLVAEPGTEWHYAVGLDVMGAVVEKVSGVPFDRFVDDRILRPLGMTSSFWTVPAADAGRLATNYAEVMGRLAPLDPGAASLWLKPPAFPYGGAGLVMSARDYDAFLHMLQNGGAWHGARILKPETVALMTGNLLPPGVVFAGDVTGTGRPAPAGFQPAGFGAGGAVYTADAAGGFPGTGTYGWSGAAGSTAFVDAKRRVRVTLMLNVMGGVPGLREAVLAALVRDRPELARR